MSSLFPLHIGYLHAVQIRVMTHVPLEEMALICGCPGVDEEFFWFERTYVDEPAHYLGNQMLENGQPPERK